jgi:hypothetical protein
MGSTHSPAQATGFAFLHWPSRVAEKRPILPIRAFLRPFKAILRANPAGSGLWKSCE